MLTGHVANLFTPTSVGALMDPEFLRRAVTDRAQASTPGPAESSGTGWRARIEPLCATWRAMWRRAPRSA